MIRGSTTETSSDCGARRLALPGPVLVLLVAQLGVTAGCNAPLRERTFEAAPGEPTHPVTIHQPASIGTIAVPDPTGDTKNLRVGCMTCHSLRDAAPAPQSTRDLVEFHVGLVVEHGALACTSCHAADAPQSLRLASGEILAGAEVMRLCSQCHGPQKRDYDRGAHGGMQGYWDLSRGPRTRNNCVQCHAPHTPAYRGGQPVFPPRDRFLSPGGGSR